MSAVPPRIAVCVPAWRPDTIGAVVKAVLRQTEPAWEMVIVTQGQNAVSRDVAVELAASDRRIRAEHIAIQGACRARNAAFDATTAPVVAMTDDDCEPREDWLEAILARFATYPTAGLVGGSVVAPEPVRPGPSACPQVVVEERLYEPMRTPATPPTGWGWMGCNFAVRRSAAPSGALFDEYLGPGTEFPAAEDTDLGMRLEAAGIPMLSSPAIVVRHTMGWRYGIPALVQNQRNYAAGNGALAGKLAMLGDPRGARMLRATRSSILRGTVMRLRLLHLPIDLLRLRHYVWGWRRCQQAYEVDPVTRLLRPRPGA